MVQTSTKPASTGNIFIRVGDSPTFFVDTITVTNVRNDKRDIVWYPGTPLTSTNGTAANGLVSGQKMVYNEARLVHGVPTKVAVVDCKGATLKPGNFAGMRINVSRLPLIVDDITSSNLTRTYAADRSTWKTFLTGQLGVEWYEEGKRYDPSEA